MSKDYTALDQLNDAKDYQLSELSRALKNAAENIVKAQEFVAAIRNGECFGSGYIDLGMGSAPIFANLDCILAKYNATAWAIYVMELEKREAA